MSSPVFTYHNAVYPSISPSLPSLNCKGKTVVVTGGSRGIGRAIFHNFITAGANVFIIGRSEASLRQAATELDETAKARVGYQAADVNDQEAVKAAFMNTVEKFGGIDILVNNVGYTDKMQPVSSFDLEDYWRCYEVNVKGGLIVLQEFLKLAKPKATLINISSKTSIGMYGTLSAYSSSKLAFAKICEFAQAEIPDLREFNVHPGTVNTDGAKKLVPDMKAVDDISTSYPVPGRVEKANGLGRSSRCLLRVACER